MKILLVGNGAREHIMAEKLAQSPKCEELLVFASSMNPGIETLSRIYHVGDLNDAKAVRAFAEQNKPDFAVIGPEAPIAAGVVDELEEAGIPCASPTRKLGQLESSKSFTRALLEKYHVPGNPYFRIFKSENGLAEYAQSLGQFVVKADGLHGGKGVLVQGDHFETVEEGVEAAKKFIESDGSVVIEEKFVGQEFSLMSFVDGESVVDMPPIQDHKRAFVGDKGPNTGGMGSYNYPLNLPFLTKQDLKDAHEITVRTAAALQQELGRPYKGVMYGGFIAVKNGVRLIEYNARLGDPEAMNALSLLETDFVDVCKAIIDCTLDRLNIRFSDQATVCKYVVPEGYPTNPRKGDKIEIGELPGGVKFYLASVDQRTDGLYMLGSRAVAFVGMADTIEEAETLAQKGVESVSGPIFYREDIGTAELIQARVYMMKKLRG
ncbi:phosphoribosylamine--glycine ligase [Patescibacteria group bacterium]|nr:phosphoribosylamine--glycine ligase [Patescibacteria group bacterium]MBU1016529.1 phosphoribosylamine--glycine ligase [Patescibacteria group bacterium]MBU1684915.1 phosphoribosylamine--glycine ligase [Patescibacteria group bacterium]MBU1938333.1 phosphoribosylamine--glycine ligase [Patescibacteria group bacterium]